MSPSSVPETNTGHKSLLPLTAFGVVAFLAACKLLLLLSTGHGYGYFRDELYYLACSRHLDWGYVDQPPLIALIAWMVRSTIGDSLTAIRFLPAVAGACEVVLSRSDRARTGGQADRAGARRAGHAGALRVFWLLKTSCR